MPEPRSTGFVLEATRTLEVSLRRAREAAKLTLARLGFTLEGDAITSIRAGRGSQWRIGFAADDLPAFVMIDFDEVPGTSQLVCRVRLVDRWWSPIGSPLGVRDGYQQGFTGVLAELDEAWRELAPAAAEFPAPLFRAPGLPAKLIEDSARSYEQAKNWVFNRADDLLGGKRPAMPGGSLGFQGARLSFPDADAIELSVDEVASVLGVAAMIARQPGTLDDAELGAVERVAGRIEDAAERAPRGARFLQVDLGPADLQTVVFLREQAQIRSQLPVRRLMICLDCRTELVVNDDYQRLLERNRKLRLIMANLGTLVSETSSAFALAGTAYKFNKDDPDFVCESCQGLRAQSRMITYCPKCGARQDDGALRSCACGHDFTAGIAAEIAELDAKRAAEAQRALAAQPAGSAPSPAQSSAPSSPMDYLAAAPQRPMPAAGAARPAGPDFAPAGPTQPADSGALPPVVAPRIPTPAPPGPSPRPTPPAGPQLPVLGPQHEVRLLVWWRAGGLFQDSMVVPTMLVLAGGTLRVVSDLGPPIELPARGMRLRGRRFESIFTIMTARRIELLSRALSASPPPSPPLLAALSACRLLPEPAAFQAWVREGRLSRSFSWRTPGGDWRVEQFGSDEARVGWFTGLLGAAGAIVESGI